MGIENNNCNPHKTGKTDCFFLCNKFPLILQYLSNLFYFNELRSFYYLN